MSDSYHTATHLLLRRLVFVAGVIAAVLLPFRQAWAVAGLHQVPLDGVPELLAAFGALRGIGEAALAAGFLLWLAPAVWRRQRGLVVLRVPGSIFWVFGSASMLFGVLPAVQQSVGADFPRFVVPAGLLLLSLGALFVSLDTTGRGDRRYSSLRTRPGYALATSGWLAFLIVFVAVPIACAWSLVWKREAGGMPGLFSGIESLAASRYWSLGCLVGRGACGSAVNSVVLGVMVSALAGVIGGALALFVHRTKTPVRKAVALLACLPMITPPFLIGFGLAQVFGKAGLVSVALESAFGIASSRWFFGAWGVMIAQVVVFFPLAYFMALNALDTLSRAQIDAARFLGASNLGVMRTVVLPALRDPLTVAMLVVFVETLSDVGNPLVIGGKLRVLSTELFYSSSGELAAGEMTGVPALLLVAIALGMSAFKDYLASRSRRGNISASLDACGKCDIPTALHWIFGGVLILMVCILLTVYAMIGIGAFSEGGLVTGAFTLDNFTQGFGFEFAESALQLTGSGWDSLIASLLCAFFVAPVGSAAGMLMVWIIRRVDPPAIRWVNGISSYLLSVPSVVIGAGFMLAFGSLGLSNAGAWIMILLAMLIRILAVCMRFGSVALQRMSSEQLEMSGLLGGGGLTTFRHVVAPLLRPVFMICVTYGFVRSMTMLGSVLLLSSAENQVATTYMIDRIGIGEFGVSMAYGVVFAGCIAFVLGVGLIFVSVRARAPGWGAVASDLKAAIVLAQKSGLRG